jgi:hypothetical protein
MPAVPRVNDSKESWTCRLRNRILTIRKLFWTLRFAQSDNNLFFMLKLFFIILIIFSAESFSQQTDTALALFERWDKVDLLIMARKIPKDAAIDSIAKFIPQSNAFFKKSRLKTTERENWVFPMLHWTKIDYRSGGSDYGDVYFDYFQGGESSNHPAHDIFINDNDSNGIEDVTGKKVEALSMVNGIVFAVVSDWTPGDNRRGGNYVKIYDPQTEAMFYYSHLDSIFVKAGQIVKAGEVIAYVGRTGRKAIKGKTHLHIAYYPIENGYPKPEDIIDDLYAAQKKVKK